MMDENQTPAARNAMRTPTRTPGLLDTCRSQVDEVVALRGACESVLTTAAAEQFGALEAPEGADERLREAEAQLAQAHGAYNTAMSANAILGIASGTEGAPQAAPAPNEPLAEARRTLVARLEATAGLVKQVSEADAKLRVEIDECAAALAGTDEGAAQAELDATKTELAAKDAQLAELARAREARQTALAEKRHELEVLNAQVAELEKREVEAAADLESARAAASADAVPVTVDRLSAMREWYAEMTRTLVQISGVAVESFTASGDGVALRLGAHHKLTVAFKPGTVTVSAAQLVPADVAVDDLVAQGDLPLLVREVRSRLAC